MPNGYNPLDYTNLGTSVGEALLRAPVHSMFELVTTDKNCDVDNFSGGGIYALYYTGDFPAYEVIARQNRNNRFAAPIYVGSAVSKGLQKVNPADSHTEIKALFDRLKIHAGDIREVSNLELEDFQFRCLLVDDVWIPFGKAYLIEKFHPLWNKMLDGFGNRIRVERRKTRLASPWETIHPARKS